MGIPQFYRKLKNICNNAIIEKERYLSEKKWDYLFYDFQSMIYSTYQLFNNEINYLFHLIYYIKYALIYNIDLSETNYKIIIEYILNKYENYFIKIYKNKYDNIKNGIINYNKNILNIFLSNNNYNDEHIIIETISENVIILVKLIAETHIISDKKYSNTYIYFDGIPSKAKIKEQLTRKIYPEIIKHIKEDLKKNASVIEIELSKILLNDSPPSIGLDKPIIYKINSALKTITDPIKGQFNINNLDNYGEAEHQIVFHLNKNIKQYKNKNILLVSPDADLILLSIINYTKKINIDILKIDTHTLYTNTRIYNKSLEINDLQKNKEAYYNITMSGQMESPFYNIYNYIYIKQIIKCLGLITIQEQLDISYILLLLGDDFLPMIPNLNIDSLEDIIKLYKKSNLHIININKLTNQNQEYNINYNNFIELIKNLNAINIKLKKYNINNFILKEKDNLLQLKKIYFYTQYEKNNLKSIIFDKMYYLTKGIYEHLTHLEVITNNQKNKRYITTDKQIINYLEGCQFIFDIYINNKLKNYNWYYDYEIAPNLIDIYVFLKNKNNNEIVNYFDYTKNSDILKYLSYKSYNKYIEYLKYINIQNILNKIKLHKHIKNKHILMKKLFIYKNIKYIFKNNYNKKYLNKCINIEMRPIPDNLLVKLNSK